MESCLPVQVGGLFGCRYVSAGQVKTHFNLPTGPIWRGFDDFELPPDFVCLAVDKVGKTTYRPQDIRL
jgi:hypothetical protein